MDQRVTATPDPRPSLARKRTQLTEAEDLYGEILAHKSELNKVSLRVDNQ